MSQPPRRSDNQFEPLLAPQRPGIERHMRSVDCPVPQEGGGPIERPYAVEFGPVPVFGNAPGHHAFGGEPAAHGGRNGTDPIEGAKDGALKPAQQAQQRAIVRHKACRLGRFQFEILHMQPANSARQPGCEQCQRRGEQARGDGDHPVRSPGQTMFEHQRQSGEEKARLLPKPRRAGWMAGNGMGNTVDADGALRLAGPAAMALACPPFRVIGLADNGTNLVAPFGQRLDKAGRIGADADPFRRIVKAEQQDFHAAAPRARFSRYH